MTDQLSAVVLAAGGGTRVDAPVNKMFLELAGRPLLSWALQAMAAPLVQRLVLVVREGDEEAAAVAVDAAGIAPPLLVRGGQSRWESEWNALQALAPGIQGGEIDLVAVHDGARPFPSPQLVVRLVEAARSVGGAVPTLPCDGPLYEAVGGMAHEVGGALVTVQTPQVFRAAPLLAAFRGAAAAGFEGSDTAVTMERFGALPVAAVPGDPHNLMQ